MSLEWSSKDPREVSGDGREIVVVTGAMPGSAHQPVYSAAVSNKHSWSIFFRRTEFFIGPDDSWPNRWSWVEGPSP